MPAVPAMYPSYPHSDSTGSSDTLALSRGRSWSLAISTVLLTGAALLAGCSKEQPKAPEVRPVRTLTVTSEQGAGTAEFSGDVRPRIESRLGFRVPGKIVARLVDVGATVKKGQVLARLDPADLALAQQSAQAQLSAAKTDRDLAAADLKRFSELFAKGFISAAEQQRHQANYDGAQARYEQAAAGYRNQSNQAAYATLEADADGVVTGVDAEVGQVVSAGQPVVRLAHAGPREATISLPETVRPALGSPAQAYGFDGGEVGQAKLRQLSDAADPRTRTFEAKYVLGVELERALQIRLEGRDRPCPRCAGTGRTVKPWIGGAGPRHSLLRPRAALFRRVVGSGQTGRQPVL